jgi:surface antigen
MRRLLAALFAVLAVSSLVLTPRAASAYAACNCTAWASAQRPDLPLTLGNALTWASRARATGFPVDDQPRVGDIIVLQPGVQGAHGRYGHVAYVTAVSGTQVTVSEMNGGGGCRVVRAALHPGPGASFIHRQTGDGSDELDAGATRPAQR